MDENANARAFKRSPNRPETELVSFDPQDPATPMVRDRADETEYENHEDFEEEYVDDRDNATIWTGLRTGGVPDETTMTIEEEMLGGSPDEGGMGGTGGPATGFTSPAGMSEDLTQGEVSGGGRYGGPTGGDVYGAGRNPDAVKPAVPPREEEIHVGSPEETEEELLRHVANQNTTELLKHPPE